MGRQGGFDDLLHDRFLQGLVRHLRPVLGGEHHRLDAPGRAALVLDGHLTLGVGPQPRQGAAFPDRGLALHQGMGIGDGHGHEHRGLVAGIAEHQALVARSLIQVKPAALVHPLGDVTGLLVDGGQHRAGLPVKAHGRGVVADIPDGFAHDLGHVHPGGGGDLTGNEGHAGGDQAFAGHPGVFVLGENGI